MVGRTRLTAVVVRRRLEPNTESIGRSSLTIPERTNYITAVKCLAAKPPKYSASVAPGARSRYDDFVVTHIQQTLSIHGTVSDPGSFAESG